MLNQILNSPYVEYFAAALALAYLLLAMRESWWCWPMAIVSSCLYVAVFFNSKLYTESVLQLFYAAMSFYGWWLWKPGSSGEALEKIKVWALPRHLLACAIVTFASLPLALALANYTDASLPWIDTPITLFSIFTTYLVAIKVLENWIYWIVIDSVSAAVYYCKGLHVSSLLFVLYTVLAYFGWLKWKRQYQAAKVL